MTKKIIMSYRMFLLMAILLVITGVMTDAMTVNASEVTGTLSSDTSSNPKTGGDISGTVSDNPKTSGDISGTVSSDSSGSGGSGGSSSGGSRSSGNTNDSSSNAPTGEVLGASTNNTQAPGFPNAGFASTEVNTAPSYWSVMISFFRNILSF